MSNISDRYHVGQDGETMECFQSKIAARDHARALKRKFPGTSVEVFDGMARDGAADRWTVDSHGWMLNVTGRKGLRRVECPGDAHSNPHIDYCAVCSPNWGFLYIPEKYKTLKEYRDAKDAERAS